MAQVGDFHRRAQIICAALVLNVAAGIGQADAKDAVTFETAQMAVLLPTSTVEPAKSHEGKVIYLTFDDGPTVKYTKRVLDLLDQYDAKATFFQVGENATAHPELTRSVIERGHALGNHTWSHRDMRKLRPRDLNGQITRTSAALFGITGQAGHLPASSLRSDERSGAQGDPSPEAGVEAVGHRPAGLEEARKRCHRPQGRLRGGPG